MVKRFVGYLKWGRDSDNNSSKRTKDGHKGIIGNLDARVVLVEARGERW